MAAAGVAPAAGAAGLPPADVICLLDSDDDQPQPQQQVGSSRNGWAEPQGQSAGSAEGQRVLAPAATKSANRLLVSATLCPQLAQSGRGPGPSQQAAAGLSGRQQQPQQQRRPAAAEGRGGGGGDVIDLTSNSPPQEDGELQIVRSTVQRVQRGPMRGVKRPRHSPQQQQAQQLSPMKALLVQAARVAAALPPPPPEPEPEGPKCGICMEVGRLQGWFRGRRAWERRQADATRLLLGPGCRNATRPQARLRPRHSLYALPLHPSPT